MDKRFYYPIRLMSAIRNLVNESAKQVAVLLDSFSLYTSSGLYAKVGTQTVEDEWTRLEAKHRFRLQAPFSQTSIAVWLVIAVATASMVTLVSLFRPSLLEMYTAHPMVWTYRF